MRAFVLLLAGCAFLFAACGGGGATVDCTKACDKTIECDSETVRAECEANCGQINDLFSSQAVDGLNACFDSSCDQIDTCMESVLENCTGSIDNLAQKICEKMQSCGAQGEIEACKQQMLANEGMHYMRCLNGNTIADLISCVQAANCTTFEADMEQCVEDTMGIFIGDDGTNGGGTDNP
jgi:hypothetical protein